MTRTNKSGRVVTSIEMTLLPKTTLMGTPAFAWKGDSGALVFDYDKQPSSMIWGGPEHAKDAGEAFFELKGVVCATPITVVLQDIQKTLKEAIPTGEVRVYLA